MFIRSVYVSDYIKYGLDDFKADEIVFTSLHIAEEYNDDFKTNAIKMLKELKRLNLKIMVDISPRALKMLEVKSIREFSERFGISIIRFDFGFSDDEIIEASEYVEVAINASTNDFKLADKIKSMGREVYAVHNFYPRVETGLDQAFFKERNKILKAHDIKVLAFIPGDERLRGPMYEGLPTLEIHRNIHPYVAYLDLVKNFDVDGVMVGDPKLSRDIIESIALYERDHVIEVASKIDDDYSALYNMTFTIRSDSPSNLCRLKESREYATFGKTIKPKNTILRKKSSITIDNEKYLRYSGEIQITKEDFKADERVNVIGEIVTEDLVEMINRDDKIKFIKEKYV